ncbi:MAG TPA: adenine phosphoribosyltransferase [Balneolaceae bacterium]|nr:adenine phosphoribosyltransferase [Balneolaceae bacterium]
MDHPRKENLNYIKEKIRNIPDFPNPGIQFKDITPLLRDAKALRLTANMLAQPFLDKKVDFVVGIESRGFLFGPVLAKALEAGFIPIRKPGKLPAETIEASYELEYGKDSIEMHLDAFSKGDRIIIHDDLIATGGSAAAATTLINELQGTTVGYSFIIELEELRGRDQLPDDALIDILISL